MSMADFSNAQKLAAVVSEWARPAIAQIATEKIVALPWMAELQQSMMNVGLVGNGYRITQDIQPILIPAVNALITPMLEQQFGRVPDSAIPQMARDIVKQWQHQGSVRLLDGLITLEERDISELKDLIEANLPLNESQTYQVRK